MTNYMTLEEAGQQLGLAPSTLRRQAQNGILRAKKIGRTYVVSPKEVRRYRDVHKGAHGNRRDNRGRLVKPTPKTAV